MKKLAWGNGVNRCRTCVSADTEDTGISDTAFIFKTDVRHGIFGEKTPITNVECEKKKKSF